MFCHSMRLLYLCIRFKRLYVMELPKDPMMLFSVINMKLRDCYSSLDELCEDMNVDKDELVNQLKAALNIVWNTISSGNHFLVYNL